MKKLITGSIHALSVFLLLISLVLINLSSGNRSLLSVLNQPEYLSSSIFEERVSETLDDVLEYIELRDLFEKKGTLNLNQVIAQADESGTTVSYTLNYLIQYARSMGYYLNAKNELQFDDKSASLSKSEDEREHQIRITFRAYLPEYRPASPSDGITTVGHLAREALGYLGRYYSTRSALFDKSSNLSFRIIYSLDGKSTEYGNSGSLSSEEIYALGKYLLVDSDTLEISTNLGSPPENILPRLQAKSPYSGGKALLFLGIDSSFSAEDAFADEASHYESRRFLSMLGLALMLLSLALSAISFAVLLHLTGHGDDRQGIVLYPMDNLPTELILLIFILWYMLSGRITPVFLDSLVPVVGELSNPELWEELFGFSFVYLLLAPLSLSLVRKYKAERLWKDSALKKLSDMAVYYIRTAANAIPRFYSIVFLVIPNIGAAALITALSLHFLKRHSLIAFLTALAVLLIILLIDFYSWHISSGLSDAVDKQVKSERLRTDLITNVSHDLKTPLTSIINYVDLLKREDIQNPRVREYLRVLEQKSARLKALTEDLVEASKASSGNVNIELMELNYGEIVQQALGEFEDKINAAGLIVVERIPAEPLMILSDGRHLWRVMENLLNNCCKYALRSSRIYVDLYSEDNTAVCTIKNISQAPLNISPDELTERFVRGDVSRSTEGSGLGLSIAKSLTRLMGGELRIEIDGDLYKASIRLPMTESDRSQ